MPPLEDFILKEMFAHRAILVALIHELNACGYLDQRSVDQVIDVAGTILENAETLELDARFKTLFNEARRDLDSFFPAAEKPTNTIRDTFRR